MERFNGNPDSKGCVPEVANAIMNEINEMVGSAIVGFFANLADRSGSKSGNWIARHLDELSERLKKE